jgi:hypothetical protein
METKHKKHSQNKIHHKTRNEYKNNTNETKKPKTKSCIDEPRQATHRKAIPKEQEWDDQEEPNENGAYDEASCRSLQRKFQHHFIRRQKRAWTSGRIFDKITPMRAKITEIGSRAKDTRPLRVTHCNHCPKGSTRRLAGQ